MKLRVFFLLDMLLICFSLKSQHNTFGVVDRAEIEVFITALTKETAQIRDMKANFKQTKKVDFLDETVVSTGVLYFAEGKRLRWEYEHPYPFLFILNENKVWMINQGATTELDVQSNKMIKELSDLMMFGLGGTSLFESRSFDFSFRSSGSQWEVVLIPKTKEMKALYSRVELIFSASSYLMESVRLTEHSGDETLIELINQTINRSLPDALFEGKK